LLTAVASGADAHPIGLKGRHATAQGSALGIGASMICRALKGHHAVNDSALSGLADDDFTKPRGGAALAPGFRITPHSGLRIAATPYLDDGARQ
jgi:hypothetical protein